LFSPRQGEGNPSVKFSASEVETHARVEKTMLAALSSRGATQQAWLISKEGFRECDAN